MAASQRISTILGWIGATLFGGVVLAGTGAAVMALHARASVGEDPHEGVRRPLTVATDTLTRQPAYTVREAFVGRVEAARHTNLAAERAGLVTAVLVDDGDRVKAGDVVARLDMAALEIEQRRLQAERASIEADLELAQATSARRQRLAADGWSSSQAHDEARFAVSALSARRDGLDAALAKVALDLEKSLIVAPFAGEIAHRTIDEGAVVSAGAPIVDLQEIDRPQARIGVPPDRARKLTRGSMVSLSYRGQTVEGRIAAVIADLETGTRTVPVLVDLPAGRGLAMGEVVRLTLERTIPAPGAWVELGALREAERGLWSINTVTRADDGHDIVGREAVEILHIADGRAFVRGPFRDGTRVVPAGGHRLTEGQRVALLEEQ